MGGDRETRTGVKAYDAINKKFGTAAIQRGADLKPIIRVGKKYEAQMEQKQKPNE